MYTQQGNNPSISLKNNPHHRSYHRATATALSDATVGETDYGDEKEQSPAAVSVPATVIANEDPQPSSRTVASVVSRGELVLGAALSLQPMPVDFGNFYAGNIKTALVSSGVQLGLMGWSMILVAENSNWKMHNSDFSWDSTWSRGEKNLLYGLVGSYIASKLVSAWFAVDTVQKSQSPAVALIPADKGAAIQVAWQFQ